MDAVVLETGKKHHYFASANTGRGFANYYEDIFGSVPRVWYIKGGPGTGKSHLLRRVASEASARGMTVLLYHCSSDATSLDGVLLPEAGFGMLDATAPHNSDPRYPGAGDEIVNVGAFWDSVKLETFRTKIVKYSAEKRQQYRVAYDLLAAESAARSAAKQVWFPALRTEKMRAAANRMMLRFGGGNGLRSDCILSAIGMHGRTHLDTFETSARAVFAVRNRFGEGALFLEALAAAGERVGVDLVCSHDALVPTELDAVYISGARVLYTTLPVTNAEKQVNTDRFLDMERLRADRAELRAVLRLAGEAKHAADEAFLHIRAAHFSLEELYTQAMDFAKKEVFEEELCHRIFARN